MDTSISEKMKGNNIENGLSLYDKLVNKINSFYSSIWKDIRQEKIYIPWLDNFSNNNLNEENEKEKLHALFLLSKFMFFGDTEIRELLKSLYRDSIKYPIIHEIRKANSNTSNISVLDSLYKNELRNTRFVSLGNPSESSNNLLIMFRQENNLSNDLFISQNDIFKTIQHNTTDENGLINSSIETKLKSTLIRRYIFIDDLCGSGEQAFNYAQDCVSKIKEIDSSIEVKYYVLFAKISGIQYLEKYVKFDTIDAIFRLDDSFKCFSENSRYFCNTDNDIEMSFCKNMCEKYGIILEKCPLGVDDGQLLLSFNYNTPDNTLPIFWSKTNNWNPVFKRYKK